MGSFTPGRPKAMKSLFSNWQLGQKIWAGYIVMLLITLAISSLSIINLSATTDSVEEMVGQRQPAVLVTNALATEINRTASALGFFLSTKEDEHKKNYLDGIQKAGGRLKMFVALLEVRCRKIRTNKDQEPG